MENTLIEKLENVRGKMIVSIDRNGLRSKTTLKLSQKLDEIIVEIQNSRKSSLTNNRVE